ncbi:contractile injection system protein, VgrG/Pvc8 family [uncultured Litoreibacter sp.]|uniref:contractile injection system protein, VgrG/Pvc8 family n=1 Tax=uncultured Litoreibacter sp. TaxID=1392394 RepID=UPI0026356DEF|nr:contractile injection system protein, VgrG/Pvc8 family [uncultured Litoreibacter sp.]
MWTSAKRITTGAVRLTEYNFKTPTAGQEVDRTDEVAHPSGDVESYDWPGDYLDHGEGRGVVWCGGPSLGSGTRSSPAPPSGRRCRLARCRLPCDIGG